MRTLLVQTSFLGDSLLSTPVVAGIRTLFPDTELWTLSTPLAEPIFRSDPLVAGTLTFDKRGAHAGVGGLIALSRTLREREFARAFVLHRSWRTALLMMLSGIPERIGFKEAAFPFAFHRTIGRSEYSHDVLRNLAILSDQSGIPRFDTSLRVHPIPLAQMRESVRERLPQQGSYIVLVPGSVWYTKRWAWERYRELCMRLAQEGVEVVILGARDERETADRVAEGLKVRNLCGETSIEEFLCCVAHANGVVCNDSFALHVASALKRPTVAVFCATSPQFGFGPWNNPFAAVVEKEGLACKPCARHGGKVCPTGTNACMYELGSDLVYEELKRMLAAHAQSDSGMADSGMRI